MTNKFEIADLLLRVFTGVLFFYQGYDKLFRIKMPAVIEAFTADADNYKVPRPIVYLISYYTSLAELTGGLLLIFGLFTNLALYALGLDLLIVGFAFSYMNPMWNLRHVFPRFALVMALLLMPAGYNRLSLDALLNTSP